VKGLPAPLIVAAVALLGMGVATSVVLLRSGAEKARAARMAAVIAPYRRSVADGRGGLWDLLLQSSLLAKLRPRLAAVFRIRLDRLDEYPLSWWAGLIATLIAARVVTAGASVLLGFGLLPAVIPLWIALSWMLFGRFEAQRRGALYRQLPDALSMVVRALRVGQTVSDALRGVGRDAQAPTSIVFNLLSNRMAIGLPLADALTEMARDSGLPEYRFVATTLLLQGQTGGSPTEALENLAEVVRGRVALRRRAHALASEARTSAIVLGALPVVTILVLLVVAPAYGHMLLEDPMGRRVLGAAICLLVMGGMVMNGMIKKMLG
jgi:tight adherence protein B